MSSYEKIKEIYRGCRLDYFVMACSYFFDIGYSSAKELTDEQIENAEENGLMTEGFVKWLMTTAREIAVASEGPIDLVQFCMAEGIFDISYYAGKLSRDKLEEMVKSRMMYEKLDIYDADDLEGLCDYYCCDPEDFKLLGYEIDSEEEEEEE